MHRLAKFISVFGPWLLPIWYVEALSSSGLIDKKPWLISLFLALLVLGAFTGLWLRSVGALWSTGKMKSLLTLALMLPAGMLLINQTWLNVIAGFFLGISFCFVSKSIIEAAISMALAAFFSGIFTLFDIMPYFTYVNVAITALIIAAVWSGHQNIFFGIQPVLPTVKVNSLWFKVLTTTLFFSLIFWAFNFIIWQYIVVSTMLDQAFYMIFLSIVTGILFPFSFLLAKKVNPNKTPAFSFWISFCWMISSGYSAYTFELSWIVMFSLTILLFGLLSGVVFNQYQPSMDWLSAKQYKSMVLVALIIQIFWVFWDSDFITKLDAMKMPERFRLLALGQMKIKQINVFPALVVIALGVFFTKYQKQLTTSKK